MSSREQVIADMQKTIRTCKERIAELQAGDYSKHRYCGGPDIAEFIIKNRYETAIAGAERVILANTLPEDFV